MTLNEIYQKARTHMLTQNVRITSYRSTINGRVLKCAIGALIDDAHYDPSCERYSILEGHESLESSLKKSGVNTDDPDVMDLLVSLQEINDMKAAYMWRGELDKLQFKGKIQ